MAAYRLAMADGSSLLDDLKTQAPDRFLACVYAPARHRAALAALLALDLKFGEVVRATREPMIGQIKLAWWRERLEALGHGPAPAHPVLEAVDAALTGEGPGLAEMEQGWVALLGEPLSEKALEIHGELRGGILFAAVARLLGSDRDLARRAGEGWALADVGAKLTDPVAAALAWRLARNRLAGRYCGLPASLRGLTLLARREAAASRRLVERRRLLVQVRGSLLGF